MGGGGVALPDYKITYGSLDTLPDTLVISNFVFAPTQYSLHITLVDQCLKLYREGINEVCKVEQNLATGTDPQGEEIKDPMKDMMPCLFNRKIR